VGALEADIRCSTILRRGPLRGNKAPSGLVADLRPAASLGRPLCGGGGFRPPPPAGGYSPPCTPPERNSPTPQSGVVCRPINQAEASIMEPGIHPLLIKNVSAMRSIGAASTGYAQHREVKGLSSLLDLFVRIWRHLIDSDTQWLHGESKTQ